MTSAPAGASLLEPALNPFDAEHSAGALLEGAGDGELPNRSRAEDQDGVALRYLCEPAAKPSRGVDIRQHDGLVVADTVGQPHRPDIGVRDRPRSSARSRRCSCPSSTFAASYSNIMDYLQTLFGFLRTMDELHKTVASPAMQSIGT